MAEFGWREMGAREEIMEMRMQAGQRGRVEFIGGRNLDQREQHSPVAGISVL
jgi:hypothetical protein